MNRYQRGAEILQREISRLGDMMELREVLDDVGTLQQTADEFSSRLNNFHAEEQAAKERLAAIYADLEQSRSEAENVRLEAAADAEKVRGKAEAEAKKRLAEAKASIAADLESHKGHINTTAAAIKRARGELSALDAEIAERTKVLEMVRGDIEELRKRL